MKNSMRIVLVSAFLAVTVAQTNAATTTVAKTNYDSTVSIALTAYTPQGQVAIATKDVINALTGSKVGTNTLPTFDAKAKLIYRQSGTTNQILTGCYILDGTSSYFLGELIYRTKNTSVGITSGSQTTTYSYDTFSVQGKMPFTASGVSVTTTNSPAKGVVVLNSLKATVAGTEAETNVVAGTITVSGGKLE